MLFLIFVGLLEADVGDSTDPPIDILFDGFDFFGIFSFEQKEEFFVLVGYEVFGTPIGCTQTERIEFRDGLNSNFIEQVFGERFNLF